LIDLATSVVILDVVINMATSVVIVDVVIDLATSVVILDVKSLRTEVSLLRRQILSALEKVMLGDSLAAEYFLCHLISSV
jgi:hypothetical protein